VTHTFTAEGPFDELSVAVEGDVEMQDMSGVVSGAIERFPPSMFLRDTPLTQPDAAIAAFAESARANAKTGETLELMHTLMNDLNREITFDTSPTQAATTAAEAFALRRGVCQDLTHVYIASARLLGIPARYIGGHFLRADGVTAQEAGHAWAEVHIEGLGWVGFDPTNKISTTDAHVRVAVGLDYLGASPVRGTRFGGTGETLTVAINVEQAQHQSQA
ncbi:MAG TPA: transglutaminase family protein, partial [Pseudolabrys sp.]|nr:transglutaminase family protein [Pseudolabrys sp.]